MATEPKTVDYQTYSDLKDKYEVLGQKYKTSILEKQQYEMEMDNQRNLIDHYESEHSERGSFHADTDALLSSTFNSMSSSLEKSHTLREEAMDQNTEYKQLINELRNENTNLIMQNKRLHDTIENVHNEKNQKILEFTTLIQHLNQRVQETETHETNIYDKYEEKVNAYDVLKTTLEKELNAHLDNVQVEPEIAMGHPMEAAQGNESITSRYRRTMSIPQHIYTSDTTLQQETAISPFNRVFSGFMPDLDEDHSSVPVYDRVHSVQQEKLEVEIDKMSAEAQRKDEEILQLNEFIAKLKNENNNLLHQMKQDGCRPCVGIRWHT